MPRKLLLISVIIGLGLYFLLLKQKTDTSPMAAKSENQQVESSSQEINILAANPTTVASQLGDSPEVRRAIAVRSTENMIGMQRLNLSIQNGRWNLKVILQSSLKKCELGDLDLIRIDQRKRAQQGLLLTIEDLDSRAILARIPLSLEELNRLGPHTLIWPAAEGNRSLGLFLCSASQNRNSCFGKPVLPSNTGLDKPRERVSQDRIYFFQYMHQDQFLSYLNPAARNPDLVAHLQKVLVARGMEQNKAQRLSTSVDQWHRTLGSLAPLTENQGQDLVLVLPQNDPSCP